MIAVVSRDLDVAIKGMDQLHKKLPAEEEKAVKLWTLIVVRLAKESVSSRGLIRKRSGLFSASINARTKRRVTGIDGYVGSSHPAAALFEEGIDKIEPKRVEWLTIPVGPALTASGVPKGPAKSFSGLRFWKNPHDPKTAYLTSAEDGELYFVLKKRVPGQGRFKAKRWLSKPIEKSLPEARKLLGPRAFNTAKRKSGLK